MMRKIIIIGAALGLGKQIASLLPVTKPSRQLTDFDKARIDAANRKRARRIERNRSESRL